MWTEWTGRGSKGSTRQDSRETKIHGDSILSSLEITGERRSVAGEELIMKRQETRQTWMGNIGHREKYYVRVERERVHWREKV